MSDLVNPANAPPGVPSLPSNDGATIPGADSDPVQPAEPAQPPQPPQPPLALPPAAQPPTLPAAGPVPHSAAGSDGSGDHVSREQPSENHAIPRAPPMPMPQDAAAAPVPPPVNLQPQPQDGAADAQSPASPSPSPPAPPPPPPESSTLAQSSASAPPASSGTTGSSTAASATSPASSSGTLSASTRPATQQPLPSVTGTVPTGPTDLNISPGGSTNKPSLVSPGTSSSSEDPFWSNQIIVASVWAGVGLILLIGLIVCIRVRYRKKSKHQQLHHAHRHDAFLPSTAPARFNPTTGTVRPTAAVNPMSTASGGSGSYAVSAAELNAALQEEKEMAAREKEEEERQCRMQQHMMAQPASMMYHHQPHPSTAAPKMRAPAPPPPVGVAPYQAAPTNAYHPGIGSYYASSSAPASEVGYLDPATGLVYAMYGAPASVVHTSVPVPQQHHMHMEDLEGDPIATQLRQYEHQRVPSAGSSVLYAPSAGSRSASPAPGMPAAAASGVAGGGGAVYARPMQHQQQAPGMTHSSSNYSLHDES